MLSSDVISRLRTHAVRQKPSLRPIEKDGEKYYLMFLHPDPHYKLKVMMAKAKYKHERWMERYNRWRASRGKPPYKEIVPEVGVFDGVKFR